MTYQERNGKSPFGNCDFALTATSVSRPHEAVSITLHGSGIGPKTFLPLSRALLNNIRLASPPS